MSSTAINPTAARRSISLPAPPAQREDRMEGPSGPWQCTSVAFVPTPWHRRLQEGAFQPALPQARAYDGVPLAMHFDDIANALSISAVAHGQQPIGGPVLIHTLLALGWLLSWGMGTVPAVHHALDARHLFRRLRTDRAFLESLCRQMEGALQAGGDPALRRTLATAEGLLERNRAERADGAARAAFTGVAAAIGTFLTGGAAGMELLSDAWSGAEGVANWGLRIGAPFMGVFAVGACGEQVHRMLRVAAAGPAVPRARAAQTWGEGHVDVSALLNHRRKEVFWQSVAYSGSLLGMGAGIQLIAFWSPQGVWPLIPGVLGMCVASYTEHENVAYRRPLSLDAALRLDSDAALVDRLIFTQLDYQLLKSIKSDKRDVYPWAAESPWLLGAWPRGVQWLARCGRSAFGPHSAPPTPSAQRTLLAYLAARAPLALLDLERAEMHGRHSLPTATALNATGAARLQEAQARVAAAQAALPVWGAAATMGDDLPPAEALALLFDFLQTEQLHVAFSHKLMNGGHLHDGQPLRQRLGVDREVDLGALATQLAEDTPGNRQSVQGLFAVAEDVLLNTFKAWQHSRARELCDLLLQRPAVADDAALCQAV